MHLATDVRARLQKAITASNGLFESNMHCAAIIIKLKGEVAALRVEQEHQEDLYKNRIETLLEVRGNTRMLLLGCTTVLPL